jgi:UrcA family protein
MYTLASQRKTRSAITVAAGIIAGSLFGALSATPVSAAPDDVPTLIVKYDVQSLDTGDGARALYRRLEFAARQVCPEPATRNLGRLTAVQQCRAEAIARAVRQINNPMLAQVVAGGVTGG